MGVTKDVLGNQTRFPDLINDDNFCHTTSRKQLAIKGQGNIDLFVRDKVLKLSDALYISSLIMNFISITRLWHNGIGVVLAIQPTELFFNRTIFAYADNMRD